MKTNYKLLMTRLQQRKIKNYIHNNYYYLLHKSRMLYPFLLNPLLSPRTNYNILMALYAMT